MVSISQWPLPPTSNAGLELAVRHVDHESAAGGEPIPPRPPLYTHSPNDSYTTSFQDGEHAEKAILTSSERNVEPVSVFDTERRICGVKRRTFYIFLAMGLGLVIVVAVVGAVAAVVSSHANKSADSAQTTSSSTSAVQISTSKTSSMTWPSTQILPPSNTPTPITESTSIITPIPSPAEPAPSSILADPSIPTPAPAPATAPQAETPTTEAPLVVETATAPVDPNATTVFAPSVEFVTVTAPTAAATP